MYKDLGIDESVFVNHDEMGTQEISFDTLSQRDKRALIFHLLYAAEAFDYQTSLESIIDNFKRGFNFDIPLDSDVAQAAARIIQERDSLDTAIKPLLNHWRFDRIGVCTKLILRFALWEMLESDISVMIILNEAIELAKCFAEKDAYKFINGVLDEALKNIQRPHAAEAVVAQ